MGKSVGMIRIGSIHGWVLLICLLGTGLASAQPMRCNLVEKRWLDEHSQLRIGVVEQTPPLLFYSGSQPQGLVADYLRALALHLGLQLEIIRYENRTQLSAALKRDVVDAVGAWPAGLSADGTLLASRPYLNLPVAVYGVNGLAAKGLPGLQGHTFAVLRGGVWEQFDQLVPGAKLAAYPTLEEALQAAADGQVDGYLGDAASADYLLKRRSIGGVEPQLELDLTYDLALATPADSPELLSLLQKGLDRIGPDELQEIWHRWPGVERPEQYVSAVPAIMIWLPLLLLWSGLLVWIVRRYERSREYQHHERLKQSIRRYRKRERRLKWKLMVLKRKALDYRGEARNHRRRLNLIDEVLPSAAWVWEPDASSCQWDEQMYRLFRQDPEHFDPNPESILERIHEDDRDQVAALFDRSSGETQESHLKFRLALPEGEIRWLLDYSSYSVDPATGKGQRIGLCWDITDYQQPAQPRIPD